MTPHEWYGVMLGFVGLHYVGIGWNSFPPWNFRKLISTSYSMSPLKNSSSTAILDLSRLRKKHCPLYSSHSKPRLSQVFINLLLFSHELEHFDDPRDRQTKKTPLWLYVKRPQVSPVYPTNSKTGRKDYLNKSATMGRDALRETGKADVPSPDRSGSDVARLRAVSSLFKTGRSAQG